MVFGGSQQIITPCQIAHVLPSVGVGSVVVGLGVSLSARGSGSSRLVEGPIVVVGGARQMKTPFQTIGMQSPFVGVPLMSNTGVGVSAVLTSNHSFVESRAFVDGTMVVVGGAMMQKCACSQTSGIQP